MRRTTRQLVLWGATLLMLGAFALAACGTESYGRRLRKGSENGSSSADAIETLSNLPCEVERVFRSRCQTCHGVQPAAGATVRLVTHEDLHRDVNGKKVYELVGERIHDDARVMPPRPAELTAEEIEGLDHWIDSGARATATRCDLPPAPDAVKPLNCKPDVILKGTKPFTMPTPSAPDLYMCFGATVDVTKKRHVTALAPHVDNKKILHHILLFKSSTPVPAEPFVCSGVGSAAWALFAAWAPGGTNLVLPPEAGFPEDVGATHWVVQLHYNDLSAKYAGEVDQSGYELCTTEDLRANDAAVAAFGIVEFAVPPRSKYTLSCVVPATVEWFGKKVFNGLPHMHLRGAALSTERIPLDGSPPQMIFERKNYDFNDQSNTDVSATIEAGDVLRTRCSWKNTTDAILPFGESTESEMCFNFLSYYPAIPGYPWVTPSLVPTCVPELERL